MNKLQAHSFISHYQEEYDVKPYYCLHLYNLNSHKKNKSVISNKHISVNRVI